MRAIASTIVLGRCWNTLLVTGCAGVNHFLKNTSTASCCFYRHITKPYWLPIVSPKTFDGSNMPQPAYKDVFRMAANWHDSGGDYTQLEKYLGATFPRICYLVHEGLCDTPLSRKIQMLNGPHHRTLIRAYLINHEGQEEAFESKSLESRVKELRKYIR